MARLGSTGCTHLTESYVQQPETRRPRSCKGRNVQQFAIKDESKTAAAADYEVVGTAPFDIFPTYEEWIKNFMMDTEPDMGPLAKYHFGHLPVWLGGNVYLNGASVCKHETENLVVSGKSKAKVSLKSGKLTSNLKELLGDYTTGVITTRVLGSAFEPEQRFENRDGTDIIFNEDFFGNHRGCHVLPGPFVELADEIKVL